MEGTLAILVNTGQRTMNIRNWYQSKTSMFWPFQYQLLDFRKPRIKLYGLRYAMFVEATSENARSIHIVSESVI